MKRWLACLLVSLGLAQPIQATVLLDYGFDALVRESKLIVQAEVLERHSEAADLHADDIHTVVTLRVSQVFKGSTAGDELELSFLGGAVAGEVLEVSGQFLPSVGDEAIFFITDPNASHINPLTGWFQGYFPIVDEGGTPYLDLSDRPDLILANATDPLLKKMLNLGVSEAELERRFPGYARFTLEDFLLAIEAEVAAQEGQ